MLLLLIVSDFFMNFICTASRLDMMRKKHHIDHIFKQFLTRDSDRMPFLGGLQSPFQHEVGGFPLVQLGAVVEQDQESENSNLPNGFK